MAETGIVEPDHGGTHVVVGDSWMICSRHDPIVHPLTDPPADQALARARRAYHRVRTSRAEAKLTGGQSLEPDRALIADVNDEIAGTVYLRDQLRTLGWYR